MQKKRSFAQTKHLVMTNTLLFSKNEIMRLSACVMLDSFDTCAMKQQMQKNKIEPMKNYRKISILDSFNLSMNILMSLMLSRIVTFLKALVNKMSNRHSISCQT